MSLEEIKTKVLKLTSGRKLEFRSHDYIFVRILVKSGNTTIYEVEEKDIPIYIVPDELYEQYYHHSPVVRLTKLTNDDTALEHRFFTSGIRMGIDSKACRHLIQYDQEGLVDWNGNLYHAVKYEDPCVSLHDWVTVDHAELNIKPLEVYRLIKGGLESFEYLEKNGYVLTQYDPKNIFAGAYFEDRFNFFRLMFKGHKDPKAAFPYFKEKTQFSPPESEPVDIYKSYEFSLGLLAVWAILSTFGKGADFLPNYHDQANSADLHAKIKQGCTELFEGDDEPEPKALTEAILTALVEYDIKKRRTPKELLAEKYFEYFAGQDEEEYKREIEENERERKKMEEEEKKNFDA